MPWLSYVWWNAKVSNAMYPRCAFKSMSLSDWLINYYACIFFWNHFQVPNFNIEDCPAWTYRSWRNFKRNLVNKLLEYLALNLLVDQWDGSSYHKLLVALFWHLEWVLMTLFASPIFYRTIFELFRVFLLVGAHRKTRRLKTIVESIFEFHWNRTYPNSFSSLTNSCSHWSMIDL